MHKLKSTMRTATLYVLSVMLVSGVPLASFADTSPACVAAYLTTDRWGTDTRTGECTLLYNKSGKYVGPYYMAPGYEEPAAPVQESPAPSPEPAPASPAPESGQSSAAQPQGGDITVNDNGSANSTGIDSTTNGTSDTEHDTDVTATNGIESTAQSGNATVSGNESKGGATSGNTDVQATVVNSVHSTVDGGSTGVATFTYDINGDIVGDITLNSTNGPVDVNKQTNLNSNTEVNNDISLANDVVLHSASGDAVVRGNESSGSATSGSANAVANVLNLINTIIAANQSFVGTINIYGNLNGDILLSPELIPQLIAANDGTVMSANNLALSTDINNDTSIVNNVNLNAMSGDASVSGNESGGSATTGNVQTNLTILNLTGHTVNAANSLLVFVNVLGTWVGMIVDAPGATAAALGTGIISSKTDLTDTTTVNNNSRITNNIDLTARSGNASVSGNESSGDALSGDATASANIANISTSTFNLSGWFGVLYINVFGEWLGSFGVDTEAGTVTPIGGMAAAPPSGSIASPALYFGFNPATSQKQQHTALALGTGGAGGSNTAASAGAAAAMLASTQVLGASTSKMQTTLAPIAVTRQSDPLSVALMVGGFSAAGISGAWMFIRRRMEMRSAAASL